MRIPGTYHIAATVGIVLILELLAAVFWVGCWWLLDAEVQAFRLERPEMLYGLLIGPVLALLFLLDLAWRNRALKRFAAAGTLARMVPGNSNLRVLAKFLLLRHALSFIVVAMTG
ncbi:MAG: hypothetical protein ACO1NQ_10410, partial [Flavobacteriales bacterium]